MKSVLGNEGLSLHGEITALENKVKIPFAMQLSTSHSAGLIGKKHTARNVMSSTIVICFAFGCAET